MIFLTKYLRWCGHDNDKTLGVLINTAKHYLFKSKRCGKSYSDFKISTIKIQP